MDKNILLILLIVIVVAVAILMLTLRLITNSSFYGGSRTRDITKDLEKYPRSKAEKNVIDIFEKLTGEKFPTVYPGWLRYRGKQLELDGYNSKLKLAIEFSGPQHTKWYPLNEPYEKYLNRIKNDEVKKKLCKKHGVRLVIIDKAIPRLNLTTYIKSRLYDAGILSHAPVNYIPEIIVSPDIDPNLQKLAEEKKPSLLASVN